MAKKREMSDEERKIDLEREKDMYRQMARDVEEAYAEKERREAARRSPVAPAETRRVVFAGANVVLLPRE